MALNMALWALKVVIGLAMALHKALKLNMVPWARKVVMGYSMALLKVLKLNMVLHKGLNMECHMMPLIQPLMQLKELGLSKWL